MDHGRHHGRPAQGPEIDLRRLRYFIAVCDNGGFSRAAGAVGIAQPALTRQIKLLEQEIGLPLIHRTGRGAEPTSQGRFLLERSRGHLDGLDDLVRELRGLYAGASHHVALGICPTIAPLFLDDLTAHLQEALPMIELSVIRAYSGDLCNLMVGGRLDVALTYRPADAATLDCLDLLCERLVLVTGEGRAGGAQKGPRALGELASMRLILPSRIHELRRIIERVCAEQGVVLHPELELDSLDAVIALLADPAHGYATILPFHSVSRHAATVPLDCVPIAGDGMERIIAMVTPRDMRASPVRASLASWLSAHAATLKSRFETVF